MNTYVLSFRGHPASGSGDDLAEKWGAWMAELGSSIANPGSRVGDTATVSADGAADLAPSVLSGFMLLNADTLSAATDLARGCPGLAYGVSVEVGELVEL